MTPTDTQRELARLIALGAAEVRREAEQARAQRAFTQVTKKGKRTKRNAS